MLKINATIHTDSGITISTGSVIQYDTNFVTTRVAVEDGNGVVIGAKSEVAAHFNLKVWDNASKWEDGTTRNIPGNFEEFGIGYVYNFTDAEWDEVKAQTGPYVNVFAGMEALLISALENGWDSYPGVGAGNVVHFDPIEA